MAAKPADLTLSWLVSPDPHATYSFAVGHQSERKALAAYVES